MKLFSSQKQQNIKVEIPNTPFKFLWHVTKPHKKWTFLAIIIIIFASAFGQSINIVFKWIVDAAEQGDMNKVLILGMLYPLAVLVRQLSYSIGGWFGMLWVTHTQQQTFDVLTGYTLKHSHTYFSDRFAGSLLSKITNVVGAMESFIMDLTWTYLTAFVSALVSFIFIVQVDVYAGLLFIVLIFVLVILNIRFSPKKRTLSHRAAALMTKLRGSIVDSFTNVGAVRQYTRTNSEVSQIEKQSAEGGDARRASWGYSEKVMAINSIVLFVFASGMFYFFIMQLKSGSIGIGDFVFMIALIADLTNTLKNIGRTIATTDRVIGEAREGLDDILKPYEIVDAKNAKKLTVSGGKIEWQNVDFEFGENKVFRTFNLTIEPGERIGLVGHSGAGKSTFVSLLLRQHDLTGGALLIDGQNIAEVTQDSLREHIAVVPQEPMLFHRTIRENIAYGNEKATQKEIEAVARKAQAHDFIMALSEGYETLVGERGIKLSGGQKQRVAIARAMLKNAPILILDEATSALDSESEVAIQKALHELMEGKTVVAVAHRLSTLREMDRIIVMEEGKIIENGSHQELVAKDGVYARLWAHQAGGFLTE